MIPRLIPRLLRKLLVQRRFPAYSPPDSPPIPRKIRRGIRWRGIVIGGESLSTISVNKSLPVTGHFIPRALSRYSVERKSPNTPCMLPSTVPVEYFLHLVYCAASSKKPGIRSPSVGDFRGSLESNFVDNSRDRGIIRFVQQYHDHLQF